MKTGSVGEFAPGPALSCSPFSSVSSRVHGKKLHTHKGRWPSLYAQSSFTSLKSCSFTTPQLWGTNLPSGDHTQGRIFQRPCGWTWDNFGRESWVSGTQSLVQNGGLSTASKTSVFCWSREIFIPWKRSQRRTRVGLTRPWVSGQGPSLPTSKGYTVYSFKFLTHFLGTVLFPRYSLSHLLFRTICERDIIIFILQLRNLRQSNQSWSHS